MEPGCLPLRAQVAVTVNQAPVLGGISVVSCRGIPEGRQVRLRATVLDPEGKGFRESFWNPGDGDGSNAVWVEGSNELTYTYAFDKAEANVVAIAYDAWGGPSFFGQRISLEGCGIINAKSLSGLRTQAGAPAGAPTCGVDRMTVRSGGDSQIHCAPNAKAIPLFCQAVPGVLPVAQRCPQGQVPFRCDLGPYSPHGPLVHGHALEAGGLRPSHV